MAVIKIIPMPGPQGPSGSSGSGNGSTGPMGPTGATGASGSPADTGNFVFDQSSMTTNDDMTIGVTGVPGTINLNAYAGVHISSYNGHGLTFGQNQTNKIYTDGSGLTLEANDGDMNLYMDGAAYIGNSISDNRIVVQKDLNDRIPGTTVRYSPVFQATGLAFTGSDTTYPTYNSYYTKSGNMVSFVIEVDCSTVTNFGTGQYKLQLPFQPAVGFNHFSGWAWADPNIDPDTGTGHTIINADTAGVTDVLDLHYLKSSGGANSPIREGLFLQNTPVTLSTISKIYVNGTYIVQ